MRCQGVPFVGGFLAMAAHIYALYGFGDWLAPSRLSMTIGHALIFAHLFSCMVYIAQDWRPHAPRFFRTVLIVAGSFALGFGTWWSHVYLFLYQQKP